MTFNPINFNKRDKLDQVICESFNLESFGCMLFTRTYFKKEKKTTGTDACTVYIYKMNRLSYYCTYILYNLICIFGKQKKISLPPELKSANSFIVDHIVKGLHHFQSTEMNFCVAFKLWGYVRMILVCRTSLVRCHVTVYCTFIFNVHVPSIKVVIFGTNT